MYLTKCRIYRCQPWSAVRYDAHPTTSIQNRFEALEGLGTAAVFSVDDDVRMPCAALARGYRAWRANPDVLVGYYPRMHQARPDGCGWRYMWNDLEMWWGRGRGEGAPAAQCRSRHSALRSYRPQGRRAAGSQGHSVALHSMNEGLTCDG